MAELAEDALAAMIRRILREELARHDQAVAMLTARAAAALLGVCGDTLDRLRHADELRGYWSNGHIYFKRGEVLALKELRQQPKKQRAAAQKRRLADA